MVGMPHNPKSFLKWLRESDPRPAGGQVRYSDEDRQAIVESLKKAARLKEADEPPTDAFFPLLNQIEDMAAMYVALKEAFESKEGWPSRTDQRQQLRRLADATKPFVFCKAVSALHPSLWPSILVRADTLDPKDWHNLIGGPEINMDAALAHAEAIRDGASRTLDDFQNRRSRPGPKTHFLSVWFAKRLVPVYEKTTGKKATAYHTAYNTGPFGRFVMACLGPLDPTVSAEAINEALYNQLFKSRR